MCQTVRDILSGQDSLPDPLDEGSSLKQMYEQMSVFSKVSTHRYYQAKVAELLLIEQAWIWRAKQLKGMENAQQKKEMEHLIDSKLKGIGYTLGMLKKRHCMIKFFAMYPRFLYTMSSIDDLQRNKSAIETAMNSKVGEEKWKSFFSSPLDLDYITVQVVSGNIEGNLNDPETKQKIEKSVNKRSRLTSCFTRFNKVSVQ